MTRDKRDFDPFNDRLARKIRNGLGATLMTALDTLAPNGLIRYGEELRQRYPQPPYGAYINDRLLRYRRVMATVKAQSLRAPLAQALLLWDGGLFFEVHERLESIWRPAAGCRRRLLQGLIQAAGCYLLLEAGNSEGARRLAARAEAHLQAGRPAMGELEGDCGVVVPLAPVVDMVVAALQQQVATAPRLWPDHLNQGSHRQ